MAWNDQDHNYFAEQQDLPATDYLDPTTHPYTTHQGNNPPRFRPYAEASNLREGAGSPVYASSPRLGASQPGRSYGARVDASAQVFGDPVQTVDYLHNPYEFYRDFRGPTRKESPVTDRRNVNALEEGMTSSTYNRKTNGTSARRPSATSKGPHAGQHTAARAAARSPPGSATTSSSLNSAKSQPALYGSARNQQPSLRDLVNRFNQNGDQSQTNLPKSGSSTSSPSDRIPYAKTRIPSASQGMGRGPTSRLPKPNGEKTPTSKAVLQKKKANAEHLQESSLRSASAASLLAPRHPEGPPPGSGSTADLPLAHLEPHREPLFGEIIDPVVGSIAPGYGIQDLTCKPSVHITGGDGRRLRPRRRSDLDISPSSPTAWYLGLASTDRGNMETTSAPLRPKHQRARSDFSGTSRLQKSAYHVPLSPLDTKNTPHQDQSSSRSGSQPNSQSKIPLSTKRDATISDSGDSPTIARPNLSPNRPSAQWQSSAKSTSNLPRPRNGTKPDSPGRKRPTTPVRTGRSRYDPATKKEGGTSPSMKAYITAPPEKQSPTLRSSRPRLPVSAASTASSRAKLTDRLEKLQGGKRPEEKPRPKPIRELGSIDFAARRERIQKAIRQEAEDKERRQQEERRRRAAQIQRDASPRPSVTSRSRRGTAAEEPIVTITSSPNNTASIDADSEKTFPTEVDPTRTTRSPRASRDDDEAQSKRETVFDDLDSPIMVVPGGFPDSITSTPKAEEATDPLLAVPSVLEPSNAECSPSTDGGLIGPPLSLTRTRTVLSQVMKLRESSPSSQAPTEFTERSTSSDKDDAESVQIMLSTTPLESEQPAYVDNYPWEDGPPSVVFTAANGGRRTSTDTQALQIRSESLDEDYVHVTKTTKRRERGPGEGADPPFILNVREEEEGRDMEDRSTERTGGDGAGVFENTTRISVSGEGQTVCKESRSLSSSTHWEMASEGFGRSTDMARYSIRRSYADTDRSHNGGGSESANSGRLSYYNWQPAVDQDAEGPKSEAEPQLTPSVWTSSIQEWLALDAQDGTPEGGQNDDKRPTPPPKDEDPFAKPPVPAKIPYTLEEQLQMAHANGDRRSRNHSPLLQMPSGDGGLGLAIQVDPPTDLPQETRPPAPDHSPPPPPPLPAFDDVTSSITTMRAQSYSSSTAYSPLGAPSISPRTTQDTTPSLQSHPRRSEDSFLPSPRHSVYHGRPEESGRESRAAKPLTESDERRVKQRKYRIKELVDTELSYFVDMMVLVEIYKKSMQTVEWVGAEDIKVLFGNADQIVNFSGALYDSLRRAAASIYVAPAAPTWSGKVTSRGSVSSNNTIPDNLHDLTDNEKDRMTSIGAAFRPHTEKLEKVYGEYIKNHGSANTKVQKLTGLAYFIGWQDQCRMMAADLTNAWSLDSLLIKPTQRVLKYHLLLEEILDLTPVDHPDYAAVEITWREMKGIGMRLDKLKERVELIGSVLSAQGHEPRKRKESDVRAGLAKAFGRRTEKFRQQVGLSEMVEDFEYKALADSYGEHYAKLQLSMRDVQDYTKEVELWVSAFTDLAMAFEGVLDDLSSSHLELESKWRRFGMFVREIAQKALPEHLFLVKKHVLEPMITLIQLHEGPQKLMQKRAKRVVEYARYKALKDRGDKLDKKTQEQGEQFMALNESLKEELPKLYSLTAKLGSACLGIYAHLQLDWMHIWVEKLKPILYERDLPDDLQQIITDYGNGDFPYTEAQVTSLGICNGSILAETYNFLSSSASFLTGNSSPQSASSRNRAASLGQGASPTLPLPDITHRHSGGNISFESLLGNHPGLLNSSQNLSAAGRARASSAMGNYRVEHVIEHRPPRSASGNTPVIGSATSWDNPNTNGVLAHGHQHFQSNHHYVRDNSSPHQRTGMMQSGRTDRDETTAPSAERPFSGVFSSALPMSDSPEPTRPPSPKPIPQFNVLFCVASLFDFNIERGRREAGYPYLNYVSGEIFDVVGEKGNLWLAKNQDDKTNTIGWIWTKHFAKLET